MSTSTILVRSRLQTPPTPAPSPGDELSPTALAAAEKLGFGEPGRRLAVRQQQATSETTKQNTLSELANLLDRCGVIPFTTDSVAKYKNTTHAAHERKRIGAWVMMVPLILLAAGRSTNPEIKKGGVRALVGLSLMSAGCFIVLGIVIATAFKLAGATVPIHGFALFGICFGVFTRLLRVIPWIARAADSAIHLLGRQTAEFEWVSSGLADYTGHVPERVLENALRLKDKLGNEATFSVESFQRKEDPLQDPDPFLVLNYRGQQVYVDFWDEPEFAKTL